MPACYCTAANNPCFPMVPQNTPAMPPHACHHCSLMLCTDICCYIYSHVDPALGRQGLGMQEQEPVPALPNYPHPAHRQWWQGGGQVPAYQNTLCLLGGRENHLPRRRT